MSRTVAEVPSFSWPSELMTVAQVADTVLLTPKTVRVHIRTGRLRAVRFGERGGYRVTREDAQAWVAEHVVRAEAERGSVDQLVRRRARLAGAPRTAAPDWRRRS